MTRGVELMNLPGADGLKGAIQRVINGVRCGKKKMKKNNNTQTLNASFLLQQRRAQSEKQVSTRPSQLQLNVGLVCYLPFQEIPESGFISLPIHLRAL